MRNGNGCCVPRMFASYCCLISNGTRKQDLLCQIMSEPGRALMWTAGIPALRQKLPLQSLGNESKGQKHSFCGMWYYAFPLVRLWLIGSVVWPNYSWICAYSHLAQDREWGEEPCLLKRLPMGRCIRQQTLSKAKEKSTLLSTLGHSLSWPRGYFPAPIQTRTITQWP